MGGDSAAETLEIGCRDAHSPEATADVASGRTEVRVGVGDHLSAQPDRPTYSERMAAAAEPTRRRWIRLSPMLVDTLLGYLVAMAVSAAVLTSPLAVGSASWPAYVFALGFGVVLLWRRRHPVPVLLATFLGICVYYTLDYPPIGLALPMAAALFSVAEAGRVRIGVVVSLVLVGLAVYFQVAEGRAAGELLGYEVPPVVALMGASLALGDGTRSRRLLQASQRERERQTRLEQQHRAEQLRAEERLVLARDLHDTLGHALAVVSLQSAVATESLPERIPAAQQAVGEIRSVSRQAMAELRDTVTRLRSLDSTDRTAVGLDGLPTLVELARGSGLQATLRGDEIEVSDEVGLTVYRIVQEALTNVIRHADATAVGIELRSRGDRLIVTIADDGRGVASAAELVAGNGIRGMRERAEICDGQLSIAGSGPEGGVTVCAVLPSRQADQGRP